MRSSITRIVLDAPSSVIQRTRLGFPVAAIHDVAIVLGITERQLCDALRIRRRTTVTHTPSKKVLTVDESDRLLRVLKALDRAADVFGSQDSGRRWLRVEVRSLGDAQPLGLLDTGAGYTWVMDTLGRIEHGIVA